MGLWLLVVQKMIHALVFSKDRALQLDAALASLLRNAADLSAAHLVVLFHASTPRHRSQYAELARQYGDRVHFIPETSFRRQFLEILDAISISVQDKRRHSWLAGLRARLPVDARPVADRNDLVLFLVDDCLFVGPFRFDVVQEALASNPEALGFSLRLGMNTTQCYVLGKRQSLPRFQVLPKGVLKYNWIHADGDFAYPLEISSSIYRLQMVAGLARQISFTDPNTLESEMALRSRRFERSLPALLCFEGSVAFSAPLNRVQNVYANRAASGTVYSADGLADVFDQGRRINVAALDGFVPTGCHQEVDLDFEQGS
jgi:hypothetical protein